jgi:hypothetical protein
LREVADVDGEHHIGGTVASFGLDALDQALLGEDHVDLDRGLVVGELLEERIAKVRLAVRIDVTKVGGVSDRSGEGRREKRKRERAREWKSHHFLQLPEFKAPGSDKRHPKRELGSAFLPLKALAWGVSMRISQ